MATRLPIYQHDATPGVTAPLLRKSYQYCCECVAAGTHAWLPEKRRGIIALPPPKELDDSLLLSFEDNGALGFEDTVNNGTGSADEKRAALRPSGKLDPAESNAMRKVRNYYEKDAAGRDIPSWADRIRYATSADLAMLPSLKRALDRGA